MSKSLKCVWTLQPENPPHPIIPCKSCGVLKPFTPSGKFRLNANGTKLDAWLIYKCMTCDATWNRPIFERRNRKQIAPDLLEALQINCPEQVKRYVFDRTGLPAIAMQGETTTTVHKQIVEGTLQDWTDLEITVNAIVPVNLRLDRLLAQELGVSRNALKQLAKHGGLYAGNGQTLQLKKPPKDGTLIRVQLSAETAIKAQLNSALIAIEHVRS
ncbi:hypothetical protein PsAD2_04016 [Pseudovibrio axinellae]|uniref:Uncharacterized protein n=1 Tax=Pseudovibrio axinellae TaxID=989403 RepID=A0A165U157_9HYPH|nr:DUF1062 domain-containing protein [Pseudovibrio axinellae]KZL09416.1 hypothetical protein PsAD2_04016 [Pseudovibrio axinellae]SEQ65594.1 hypothetical protein SAMN05421798_103359 [Pseudovibrio axinellae]